MPNAAQPSAPSCMSVKPDCIRCAFGYPARMRSFQPKPASASVLHESPSAYRFAALSPRCRRASTLANFKRPRSFVFVDELPKSPVGKLLRRLLVSGDYTPESGQTAAN